MDGFSQRVADVRDAEQPPPQDLAAVVQVFRELRTPAPLPVDFGYHAVPDACVTALHTEATTLNLGTVFHYVGVQFFPGVWPGDRDEIQDRHVGDGYQGALPLAQAKRQLAGLTFDAMVQATV